MPYLPEKNDKYNNIELNNKCLITLYKIQTGKKVI